MSEGQRDDIKSKFYGMLNDKLANMTLYSPPPTNLQGRWGDLVEPQPRVSTWDTGVPVPLLQFVGAKSVDVPEQTQLHGHLAKTHVQVRLSRPLSHLRFLMGEQQQELAQVAPAVQIKNTFLSFLRSGSLAQTEGGH